MRILSWWSRPPPGAGIVPEFERLALARDGLIGTFANRIRFGPRHPFLLHIAYDLEFYAKDTGLVIEACRAQAGVSRSRPPDASSARPAGSGKEMALSVDSAFNGPASLTECLCPASADE